jgi:hypothetical protein
MAAMATAQKAEALAEITEIERRERRTKRHSVFENEITESKGDYHNEEGLICRLRRNSVEHHSPCPVFGKPVE